MAGVRRPLSQCTEAEFLQDVMRHLQSEDPSTKLIPVGGMPSRKNPPRTPDGLLREGV
jgi:hypothetical protein